jgi:uncharacterized damage-inducible protein DinB
MVARTDPPQTGTEAEQLFGFLEYQRATVLRKAAGLDADGFNATLPPSTMTLGGLLKHLAFVEDYWFSYMFAGNDVARVFADVDWSADPDWDWHSAVHDRPAVLRSLLAEIVAHARHVVEGEELDALSVRANRRTGQKYSLRWVVLHMIEEYARHNGHADLIRESIDGQRGE